MARLTDIASDWINSKIENMPVDNPNRGYLGMSQLGHECSRFLYYVLHQAPRKDPTPRTMRIFERGHWEEDRVIKDLESVGITVDNQQLEIFILGGLVKGHIDGIAYVHGVPHLLEIKTMNDTAWKKYYKQGVKASNPAYWYQAQSYANELKLGKILFCGTNKNDECRKFEFVDVERTEYFERALEIVAAMEPPDRIGGPDWWTCGMCSYHTICHTGE